MRLTKSAALWPAVAAAVASGLLVALANPPADVGPVAFVGLIPLLWSVKAAGPRRGALLGFVFGLVYWGVLLYWLLPFGLIAWLPLVVSQSAYTALFGLLVPLLWRNGAHVRNAMAAAALWTAVDWARGAWPVGGFTWGMLGNTQHGNDLMLRLAPVTGVWGITFGVVLMNALILAALPPIRTRWRLSAALAAGALVAILAPALIPWTTATGPALDVAVVQGSVPFDRSNRGLTTRAVFQRHVAMTEAAAAAGQRPDLVVWGEGAADDDPLTTPTVAAGVETATTAIHAPLLLGATTAQGGGHYATEGLLFTPSGRLADRYTKRRLVPFGEYVPASGLLRRLVPATNQLPYDKVPGTSLKPLLLDGTGFGVLICYETAYPQDASTLAREGARFVVVLANNASFGHSPLARQHLATSQLRAVEEGRTVVHAAISGLSGVVGPDGRVRQETGLYASTAFSAEVQPRSGLTLYARVGRLVEAVLVGAAVALAVAVAAAALERRRGANQARGDTNGPAPVPAARGTAPGPGASDPASSARSGTTASRAPDRLSPDQGPAPSR